LSNKYKRRRRSNEVVEVGDRKQHNNIKITKTIVGVTKSRKVEENKKENRREKNMMKDRKKKNREERKKEEDR